MNHTFANRQSLQSIFWSAKKSRGLDLFLILSGIVFLAVSSQIVIPLQPVPLTLQTAMVILLGMVYGFRLSTFSVLGYLAVGGLGLPVFQHLSSGLSGVTVGYLIGFLPAVAITGFLAERGFARNILTAFLTACLGAFIIFLFGTIVLAHFIGWEKAFLLGVMPFAITEPLKLLAISFIIPRCWKLHDN